MQHINKPLNRCLKKIDKQKAKQEFPNYQRFKKNVRDLFKDQNMFKEGE